MGLLTESLKKRLLKLGLSYNDLSPFFLQNKNYRLQINDDKLAVQYLSENNKLKYSVCVDFESGKLKYRSLSHIRAELVVKAVTGKHKNTLTVLDTTAGFGKDSYILSLAGCEVTACESNPVMYALLKDAFGRSSATQVSLINADSRNMISSNSYDVIYIDPMYPQTNKSARNNKDMSFLQDFVGHQPDMAEELFKLSLQSECKKIVIKRPPKAGFVYDKKPTSQIIGKAVRFDIYAR